MIKKLLIVSLVALGLGMTGCLTDPLSNNDSVDITLNKIPTINGDFYDIVATINANVNIDKIETIIQKKDGTATTDITPKNGQVPAKEKISIKGTGGDMNIRINIAPTTCNGDYVLTLKVTAGNANLSKSDTFTVIGKTDCSIPVGTPVVTDTLVAGANKNSSIGSSIDLDAGKVYLANESNSHVTDIDLCYAHSSTNGDKLGTANWAKLSGFDFTANWTATPPITKFYKTTMTPAQFNAITVKEQIPAFDATLATEESYTTAANDVFIVKTTANKIVLVLVKSQVAGATGEIAIKYAK